MNARLAALVALLFAAAVAIPELGLVVHRHAGGDHLHIHPGAGDRHRHAHDAPGAHDHHHQVRHDGAASPGYHDAAPAHDRLGGDDHHHDDVADHDHGRHHGGVADHDHEHADGTDHEPSDGRPADLALSIAGDGWAWHTHWTQPLQRATRGARAALAPPQPVARLVPDTLRERVVASPPAGRSRAPPRIEPI